MKEQAERKARAKQAAGGIQAAASVSLDGKGKHRSNSGLPFLDHMVDQIARHGLLDLIVCVRGKGRREEAAVVERAGAALGEALNRALGSRAGIVRFGWAYAPLDEALSRVAVDLSNRPMLVWRVGFSVETLGHFDTALLKVWLSAFAAGAKITLHVENLYGENAHHIAESCFKALGMALRQAVAIDRRRGERVPSTKETLNR